MKFFMLTFLIAVLVVGIIAVISDRLKMDFWDFTMKFLLIPVSSLIVVAIIIMPLFGIPVQHKATIKAFKWERTTYIKEYQTICEEGWYLPEGAKEISHELKEWGKSGSGTTLYADWYVYNIDEWVTVKEYQDNGEGREPDSVDKRVSDIPEKNTITEPSLGDKCQTSNVNLVVIAQHKDDPELTFRESSEIWEVERENKQVGDKISYGSTTDVWHLIFS